MLTYDDRMNGTAVDIQFCAEQRTQAGSVKNGTGAEYAVFRHAGCLGCVIGQDINRVGYHQHDSLAAALSDLSHDGAENGYILVNEVKAGFTRFLSSTGSDDNYCCIGDIVIGTGIDPHRIHQRRAMHDIHGFSLCLFLNDIQEHHLGEQTGLHQSKCAC